MKPATIIRTITIAMMTFILFFFFQESGFMPKLGLGIGVLSVSIFGMGLAATFDE